MNINQILTQEFNIKLEQVEATIKLIDEGNTIPFIARYRKEVTGSLDDQILREIHERLVYLRGLADRKEDVLRLIDEQGKLTDELKKAIAAAQTMTEMEDIYRPYKQKRRTRATMAIEKGLEPLATLLMLQDPKVDPIAEAEKYIDQEKGVKSSDDALAGAMDILAEQISDNADYRKFIRDIFVRTGVLVTKAKTEEDSVYRTYYDYREPLAKIAPHRNLAVNRGEKEGFLTVKIEEDVDRIITYLEHKNCKKDANQSTAYVKLAVADAYKRLINPSIVNEIRNMFTEQAEEKSIDVFAENLKNLLLQAPVKGRVVMGFDPAYRTGCKIAVVDDKGDPLATTVVYPTVPQRKEAEAKRILKDLIAKHGVNIISIGNGTASKESEIFVAEMIKEIPEKVEYMVVSESGASVYSASKLAAEEFPEYDVSLRSAISIARRLQDPLAELVKIDPKAIGVGQYQHDMNAKRLDSSLAGVVEYCVNSVGVDVNTASPALLSYISGVNGKIAKNICDYRSENGKFANRKDIKKVKGLGVKAFEQCAGFLRVIESENVLDNTSVHPESYDAVKKLLALVGYTLDDVKNKNVGNIASLVSLIGMAQVAEKIGVGEPTLADILKELPKTGRDPRDELPAPMLRSDVLDIKSLKQGMVLKGTVRNVADFGAFVDIGVHQDGLVHISQLSDAFVRRPMDVVSVGDIIDVEILDVDVAKKRISLRKVK